MDFASLVKGGRVNPRLDGSTAAASGLLKAVPRIESSTR